MYSSPVVADGVVYFGSDDHFLYALDVDTGVEKWTYKTTDGIWSTPVVYAGIVYVGNNGDWVRVECICLLTLLLRSVQLV